ncbi:MAG: hypothetical protein RB191_24360 [Terriglobia bacterium]|nr:hypothetical protein [Terriglobia bacterium]
MSNRSFLVFYRLRDGYVHICPNHFVAADSYGAATDALGRLARPLDYTALAVLDESADEIHLYNIVSSRPTLVAA